MALPFELSFAGYLLAGILLGIAAAARCLLQVICPNLELPRWANWLSLAGMWMLACILVLDALDKEAILGDVGISHSLSIVSLTAALFFASYYAACRLRHHSLLASRACFSMALMLTLAGTAWASHRHQSVTLQLELQKLEYLATTGGYLETRKDLTAVTDRGREIKLYSWVSDPKQPPAPDDSTNCHGWVFVGGRHLLCRDGVQQILDDNGYQICESPRPGDVIIYRDPNGDIVHTGLVKDCPFGNQPRIESKWGLGDRFVHAPKAQPYGSTYAYYRSPRIGHKLPIRPQVRVEVASR